ncbi:MAG: fumarylacetoacetate hydrolase family protein [Pseudomonadales bacterium]|nr:fumarylacetoacetate hydrolase family protein [Pseudomonadales bacterium]
MTNAIDILRAGNETGTIADGSLPELTVDEGQSLLLQVLETYRMGGDKLAGYKIGLTSGAARDVFGPGIRPFGYILGRRVIADAGTVSLSGIGRLGLENELAFRLGTDLSGANVSAADARTAVEAVAPAFEINQDRLLGKPSRGARVADNLSQWGIAVGPFSDPDLDYEGLVVGLRHNGALVQEVAALGHIDDHFESIATLARGLHAHKRHLRRGMVVFTGSYTRWQVGSAGDYVGDFGALGQVHLNVID